MGASPSALLERPTARICGTFTTQENPRIAKPSAYNFLDNVIISAVLCYLDEISQPAVVKEKQKGITFRCESLTLLTSSDSIEDGGSCPTLRSLKLV